MIFFDVFVFVSCPKGVFGCWDQSDGNCYEPINQMDSDEASNIFLWSSWWAPKIAHLHTLNKKEVPQQFTENHETKSLLFLCVKACFSSSRFIFRHLKIWKRLMLCHRTGRFNCSPVKNSAAGWNCGSLLRYAVWNPVVRIFQVCCAAVRSWRRYDRRVIGDRNGFFRQSCLDRKPPGILHIFTNIFWVPWEIMCLMFWLGPVLSFVRGVWVWLCCDPMWLENMFS